MTDLKSLRLSDYLVEKLLEEGIVHCHMVTGGGAMHLNDAFSRNKKIKVICFHHEQAAAIAAESSTRLSGVPCVVNVTTGPGGVNAMVGVYGAYVDSIPMLVVSGQVKTQTMVSFYAESSLRQLGDQEIDIVKTVSKITKFSAVAYDAHQAVRLLAKAVAVMKSGRPGPVWLDIPIDVQASRIASKEEMDSIYDSNHNNELSNSLDLEESYSKNSLLELKFKPIDKSELEEKIEFIYKKIQEAKSPVIMLGTGMIGLKKKENLELLKRSFCIPIVTGWNALELMETDHPNYVGRPGTVGDRTGNFAVQNADFILILGCRLNIRQISYNWSSFAKNAYKVMVDIDDAELNKATLKIDLKVKAYLSEFLDCFLSKKHYFEESKSRKYLEWLKERSKKYPVIAETSKSTGCINPYQFLRKLTEVLPEGAVVISGNGSACVMTYQVAIVKKNQRYITNSGCAAMGYDLPAAIGAALTNSGAPCIICLAGDGSIMMNLQELQTIKTNNLPIKIFILSNGGYLSIKQTQTAYFSDNVFGIGCNDGLDMPDFIKVGESFGISSQTICTLEDLDSKFFVDHLCSEGPKIYNVKLDPDIGFSPKLSSRKNIDGTMTSPELEDMAPFLNKEELKRNVYRNE